MFAHENLNGELSQLSQSRGRRAMAGIAHQDEMFFFSHLNFQYFLGCTIVL